MLDETGGNQQTNPDESGSQTSGDSGGKGADTKLPVDVAAALENLGMRAVPEKDWSERNRVFGSVKNGKISKILSEHDKLMEEQKKREEAELTESERLKRENEGLNGKLSDLETEVSDLALRFGFLSENAKLAADPKAVAVNPRLLEAQLPSILSEFDGGDAAAVSEFVKGGLGKMLTLQNEIAGARKPQDGPGGGPVDASGANTTRSSGEEGSVMKKMMDWRSRVAHIHNPHQMKPSGGK